jgi:hypothetical protein
LDLVVPNLEKISGEHTTLRRFMENLLPDFQDLPDFIEEKRNCMILPLH